MMAENAFNANFDVDPASLPAMTISSEEDRARATLWFHFAQQWAKAGGSEHYCLKFVASHAPDPVGAAAFFRRLVGEQAWA